MIKPPSGIVCWEFRKGGESVKGEVDEPFCGGGIETEAAREGRDHLGVESGWDEAGESCRGGRSVDAGGADLANLESRNGEREGRRGEAVV